MTGVAVGNTVKPTIHEVLHLNETLRLEALGVQQARVVAGMIGDDELRSQVENCVGMGKAHTKALLEFVRTNQIAH